MLEITQQFYYTPVYQHHHLLLAHLLVPFTPPHTYMNRVLKVLRSHLKEKPLVHMLSDDSMCAVMWLFCVGGCSQAIKAH